MTRAFATLDVRSRSDWRRWLEAHHDTAPAIWLVFHKRHTDVACLGYDDAVEEALCFGWVDSLIRRLDDDRYGRKFTPRKPDSRWSTANRRRYEALKAQGLLAPAGLRRPPTVKSGDAPRPVSTPAYITNALRRNARARRFFERLAPSSRRQFVAWIDAAKREETRRKRLSEAIRLLAAGRTLGLK